MEGSLGRGRMPAKARLRSWRGRGLDGGKLTQNVSCEWSWTLGYDVEGFVEVAQLLTYRLPVARRDVKRCREDVRIGHGLAPRKKEDCLRVS